MTVTEETKFIGLPNSPVEVGDLTKEISKDFLAKLWYVIEQSEKLKLPKIWIWARVERNVFDKGKTKFQFFALERPWKKLHQSSALFEYDYNKEQCLLLWSLPHRSQFLNILKYPERCSPEYIKTIKKYIKQEGIKINTNPIIIPFS